MPPSDTAEKGQTNPPLGAAAGAPRHYHLLWDEELEALRPVLGLVLEHLAEVIHTGIGSTFSILATGGTVGGGVSRYLLQCAFAEHQGFARR